MPAMTATAPEHSPLELHRLLANLIRTGRVDQVRVGTPGNPAACRVRTGDLLTTWVPWFAQAAGGSAQTRHWRTPALGEPCLLLAPGGDLAQAVALPGIYSSDMPQGAFDEDVERHDFSSSDFWQHRRSAGTLVVDIAQAITLNVGSSQLHITPSGTTLTTPNLTADSPQSAFTGSVKIGGVLIGKADAPWFLFYFAGQWRWMPASILKDTAIEGMMDRNFDLLWGTWQAAHPKAMPQGG